MVNHAMSPEKKTQNSNHHTRPSQYLSLSRFSSLEQCLLCFSKYSCLSCGALSNHLPIRSKIHLNCNIQLLRLPAIATSFCRCSFFCSNRFLLTTATTIQLLSMIYAIIYQSSLDALQLSDQYQLRLNAITTSFI